MNTNTAVCGMAKHEQLAPDDTEEGCFLEAIQDPEKRREVITILKHAGLIRG